MFIVEVASSELASKNYPDNNSTSVFRLVLARGRKAGRNPSCLDLIMFRLIPLNQKNQPIPQIYALFRLAEVGGEDSIKRKLMQVVQISLHLN